MSCLPNSFLGFSSDPDIDPCEHALSTNLTPKFIGKYYIRQCDVYFNSLEPKYQFFKPNYSKKICRWEWPSSVFLTGYGCKTVHSIDTILRTYPCLCIEREHRFFKQQPFARSIVTFHYGNDAKTKMKPTRMYFEFTFNDQGQITFIESWLARQGEQLPLFRNDGWPTGEFYRISTLIPGLGNRQGNIDINSAVMYISGTGDAKVAELRNGAFDFQEIRNSKRAMLAKAETIINSRARFVGEHVRLRPIPRKWTSMRIYPADLYVETTSTGNHHSHRPRPVDGDGSICTEKVI